MLKDSICSLLATAGAVVLVRIVQGLQAKGVISQRSARKLVHISGLAFIFIWPVYSTNPSAAAFAAIVPVANAARLIATATGLVPDAKLVASFSRSGDSSELLKGPFTYVLMLLAATALAWRQHPAGIIAVAMMCAGDGLADVVGKRWGQQLPLPWNKQKSWPGSAALLLGGLIASLWSMAHFMQQGHLLQLQTLGFATLLRRATLISTVCAFVESLPSSWADDNLTVPATAAALSAALLPGTWPVSGAAAASCLTSAWKACASVSAQVSAAQLSLVSGVAANSIVFAVGLPVLRKGLSGPGIAHAWLLGSVVLGVFGAGSYVLMCLYFVTGTLVTRVKLQQKQQEGIGEQHGGCRGPGSVWGSGAAAMCCAGLALITGQHAIWQVGYVASLASKLADTVSSEIGKAYGSTTYLITSLKPVPRGTEGAVSLEGSLAGLLAAAAFSLCSLLVYQEPFSDAALLTTCAAVMANLLESYLGAVLQARFEWATNDIVNVVQTCAAAAAATAGHYALLAL